MADILLTHSYFLRFDPKQAEAGKAYPPLATLYAAAELRSAGFQVGLHDSLLHGSEESLVPVLERERPRLLVIYDDGFNYVTKMCLSRMREAALQMVAMGRARGVKVVVSSSDATDHPDLYLDAGADYVIAGEVEVTLRELARHLLLGNPADPHGIDGLVLRNDEGSLVSTTPRTLVRDLDRFNRPAWDLVDVEAYRRYWLSRHGRFSWNVSTTRGCPYHCNWCAKPIYGQRYTVRTPASVAEEWAWLKQNLRPDHLWVTDDIFGLKPGWVAHFRDELLARDAVVPYMIQARADLMHEETVKALAESGCEEVWLGAESGAQEVLDAMEKGITVQEIETATRRLRQAGIRVAFFLQFGYPGEGWEEIQETLRLVRRCDPDDIGISVSYPLPGTGFHRRVRERMGTKTNWVDSNDLDPMYPSLYPRGFYRLLHRRVHAEFRLRKGWRALRGGPDSRDGRTGNQRGRGRATRRAVLQGLKQGALLPFLTLQLKRLCRPLPDPLILASPGPGALPEATVHIFPPISEGPGPAPARSIPSPRTDDGRAKPVLTGSGKSEIYLP